MSCSGNSLSLVHSSDAAAEKPAVSSHTESTQSTLVNLDLYPPIEALHFPERYDTVPSGLNHNFPGSGGTALQ